MSPTDVELLSIRQVIHNECLAVSDFPARCCSLIAERLAKKFNLEVVNGSFIANDFGYIHTWNVDTETNEIIDLSADQFGEYPSITRISLNSDYARSHYVEDALTMF